MFFKKAAGGSILPIRHLFPSSNEIRNRNKTDDMEIKPDELE